jgi:hypothetical protein
MLTTVILASFAVLFVFGVILMALELRKAPEGVEDQDGFHIISRTNSNDLLATIPISNSQQPSNSDLLDSHERERATAASLE